VRRSKSAVFSFLCGIVATFCLACAEGLSAPDAAPVEETGHDAAPDPDPGSDAGPLCNAVSCDDGKECTVDSCEDGACMHIPREGSCTDDTSSCTDDVCNSGLCTHPANGSCPCAEDGDCDDSNPCTDDTCSPERKCVNDANGAACADDGKECTDDVCAAKSCSHPARRGPCTDDGTTCTDDLCEMDQCTHPRNASCQCIIAGECDDDEACTDDSCDADHTCQHTNSTAACSADDDACTCDVCSMGMCMHLSGMSCPGASAVVIDSFDSSADWDANQTTPLHLALTGKASFDNTNLEGNAVLYVAESGTASLEMNVPPLTGLTKLVLEITASTTGTASMLELGVFDSATSTWKDRALSLYGTIGDGTYSTLEVPLADYAGVSACKITKVRLAFTVTGGQKFWRVQSLGAE
jgi:hypothetical protein